MKTIADDFDFEAFAVEKDVARVIPMSGLADDVLRGMYGDTDTVGVFLPWDKSNRDGVRYRPQEVSLYAGPNGSWKSMVTSQIGLHLMRQDERIGVLSFEMRPTKTMMRMSRQALGSEAPSLSYVKRFHRWTDGKGWLFDHFGHCPPDRVLAVMRYMAKELGIRHLFVDSLMKVVPGTDDYNAQKDFVNELCGFALANNAHVHLIAHTRKPSHGEKMSRYSVRGASEITDQVDNVYLFERTRANEDPITGKISYPPAEEEFAKADFFLRLDKQRNDEFEGAWPLWWNPRSLCLVEKPNGNWPTIDLEGVEDDGGDDIPI